MIERKLKKSLKMFMGLKKTVPNEILFSLVKVDFGDWTKYKEERARLKWKARLEKKDVEGLPKYVIECDVKLLLKEVVEFINLQCAFCKQCQAVLCSEHYAFHGVKVPTVPELLRSIRDKVGNLSRDCDEKVSRKDILESIALYVADMNSKMKSCLQSRVGI